MGKNDLDILKQPIEIQSSIAKLTKNPRVLDKLAYSSSEDVRLNAVSNCAIKTETLERLLEDENEDVRFKAKKELQNRQEG